MLRVLLLQYRSAAFRPFISATCFPIPVASRSMAENRPRRSPPDQPAPPEGPPCPPFHVLERDVEPLVSARKPPVLDPFSLLSVGLIFLSGSLHRRNVHPCINVASVGAPFMIFLAVVIGVTMQLTGGISTEAMGGDKYGGKGYMLLFGAVFGFFALSSHQIPLSRAKWRTSRFSSSPA